MKVLLLLLLMIPVQLLSQSSIAIRHINIVDIKTGAIKPDQMVVIKGNKIDDIGPDNQKSRKNATQVMDATGKFPTAAIAYGFKSIPFNLLLDKDGIIIGKNLRSADLENKLKEIFKN